MKTNLSFIGLALGGALLFLAPLPAAEKSTPLTTLERLPVKEVSVFKDGHAFVVHEGRMPVEASGDVRLDYLPVPVIGTFWAYATEPNLKLSGVTASSQKVRVERTALTLREMIEGNLDATVIITESPSNRYPATLMGVPARSVEELARIQPPPHGDLVPEKGNLVLLKTADGIKTVPFDRILDVTFTQPHQPVVANEEYRNFLTMKLDWGKQKPAKTAGVGLMYVQKGIRWIPSYKVELDGKSNAVIRLQATLINELTDLEDATVNLVIGVPTFAFKETLDPMALQQTAARLSSFFQSPGSGAGGSPLVSNFSNAMMTQVARMGDYRAAQTTPGEAPVDLPEGAKNEDLYVFTLKNVRLKKGARMVVQVAEYKAAYHDIYALEIPFAPPVETLRNINSQQQSELARLINTPKVMHKVRLVNQSQHPFTTAPALILREGRILAQGMTTYASPGAAMDLNLTTAVDIQVKKTDQEAKRTPNAFNLNNNHYLRVDLTGKLQLTNHRGNPVEIEVVRYVLGAVDEAGQNGVLVNANVFETPDFMPSGDVYPTWWSWYSWPWWWHHVNSVGKITWKVTLKPGESAGLDYAWHYFWL